MKFAQWPLAVLFSTLLSLYQPASIATAGVEVGFIRVLDYSSGRDERFHVFISYGHNRQAWLHSYPPDGVSTFNQFSQAFIPGTEEQVVEIEIFSASSFSIPLHKYRNHFGKKFDWDYKWGGVNCTYCSKLVGSLLGITATPFSENPQKIGISVDDIYEYIINHSDFEPTRFYRRRGFSQGFKQQPLGSHCESLLAEA